MSRRLVSRRVEGWVEPAVAFAALYGNRRTAFWLDSGAHATAGTSYMGAPRPGAALISPSGSSGFDFLREAVEEKSPPLAPLQMPVGESPAFRLGWVGWLGYELEKSRFVFIDRAIAFDHAGRTVTLLALADDSAAVDVDTWFDETAGRLSTLEVPRASEVSGSLEVPGALGVHGAPEAPGAAKAPEAPEVRSAPITAHWRHSGPEYLRLIRECQALIAEGEAYQLCLTNQISVRLDPEVSDDPLAVYASLRTLNPSHHGGYLRFGDTALLSSSPEQFLVVTAGGEITTKPIKGTRPRGDTPDRDRELRDELLGSEKERAENVMIVDLMRNDLGKVAQTGSVRVPVLFDVESYTSVHQLVSTVTARLADGVTGIDAVEASFPAGSMTGAPKTSAMQILGRLERGPRGIYAGAFGYFGLDGRVDLAMSIRSIVIEGQEATIGTGGGITSLSVPEEELAEIVVKAVPLLDALGIGSGRAPHNAWKSHHETATCRSEPPPSAADATR